MNNIFLNVFNKYRDLIQNSNQLKHFVETGTHMGETAKAWSKVFESVDTIELFKEGRCFYGETNLYEYHQKIKQECPNINFVYGDSGVELLKLITNKRSVILLDAHSGVNSPIYNEINAIKNSGINNHVIIIDDTPDFNMNIIKELILQVNPNYIIENSGFGRDIHIAYTK